MERRKKMIVLGLVLLIAGAWATGVVEDFLTGDTWRYIKVGGGALGSAIGLLLLERGVLDK